RSIFPSVTYTQWQYAIRDSSQPSRRCLGLLRNPLPGLLDFRTSALRLEPAPLTCLRRLRRVPLLDRDGGGGHQLLQANPSGLTVAVLREVLRGHDRERAVDESASQASRDEVLLGLCQDGRLGEVPAQLDPG